MKWQFEQSENSTGLRKVNTGQQREVDKDVHRGMDSGCKLQRGVVAPVLHKVPRTLPV